MTETDQRATPLTAALSRPALLAPVSMPFPERHLLKLTADDWSQIPAQAVPIDRLTPTQKLIWLPHIAHLANNRPAVLGTPGVAVVYQGRLYLWDGHHRLLMAWFSGDLHLDVRVVWLDDNGRVEVQGSTNRAAQVHPAGGTDG